MANNKKSKARILDHPLAPNQEERKLQLQQIFQAIEEAVSTEDPVKTETARLEFVETLMGWAYKPGAIVRLVVKIFGVNPSTANRDIRKAKDHLINHVIKQSHAAHLAGAVGRMVETYHASMKAGDRPSAVAAARHMDELLGLKENVIKLIGDKEKPLEVKNHDHGAGDAAQIAKILIRAGVLKPGDDKGDKAKA